MKLSRLSILWLCYYIIARYESPYSRKGHAKQADADYLLGKHIRNMSKYWDKNN